MKVGVLAGGKQRRMKGINKFTLHILGKPLLRYAVETLIKVEGIEDLVIIVSNEETAKVVEEFNVHYQLHEGLEGAIYDAWLSLDKPEEVMIVYGDVVTSKEAYTKVLLERKGEASILVVPSVPESHYDLIYIEDGEVILGKDFPSTYAFGGVMVLSSNTVKEIFKKGLINVINELGKKNELGIVIWDGLWLDINEPKDIIKSIAILLEGKGVIINGVVEEHVSIKGPAIIEGKVRSFSYIEGPVYIGKEAEVGPFVRLRGPVSIESRARVREFSTVSNSSVQPKREIGPYEEVHDEIVVE